VPDLNSFQFSICRTFGSSPFEDLSLNKGLNLDFVLFSFVLEEHKTTEGTPFEASFRALE